jgi:hypothetical protein
MRRIFIVCALFFIGLTQAQVDYTAAWEDFYSYNNVKKFEKAGAIIVALTDNAVFTFNTQNGDLKKISSVNGLSGETTSSLLYNQNSEKIIIGYETGLIEIVDKNNNITIAKDIELFNYSGNKRINNIIEHNNKLYIATSFAIVVYDLQNLRFGDTYFIGNQSTEIEINDIKIFENYIYAATVNGIYKAEISNTNLIDSQQWTPYFSGNFSNLEVFNNEIYASRLRSLYTITNNQLVLKKNYPQNILSLKASNAHLTIGMQRRLFVNDQTGTEIFSYTTNSADSYYFDLNTAYFEEDKIYIGTKEYGILTSLFNTPSDFTEIHPEGPVSNLPFSIAAINNSLWVVYGGYNTAYGPLNRARGFSRFNGANWINTPYNSNFPVRDLVHITGDFNNPEKVFISSWGGGMLVVENDEIITHWNHLNSGLEKLVDPNPNYINIRINGSAFDSQGNLWIANAWVDKRVKKYSADGTWSGFDMSSVMTNPALGLNELTVDKTSTIWIGSRRNGVLVFNENGNKKRALTTEATNGSLPDLNARTVKADANNRIWIGTQKGLVVLNNASNVFNQAIIDAQPIIILDDGIPKKLLGEEIVNAIEIDGANNKWFGTEFGGVTHTNANGTLVLNQFNKNNSPLPSNTILKIAIDNNSGKVYFATNKGIVAYKSSVAAYGDTLPEVYAYPNPSTKNNEFITIDGRYGEHLPYGTNVKILDTAGNLVYETNVKEGQQLYGGKVIWNKTNLAGTKVASGIYIVLLTANNNTETAVAKIAIVN